MLSSVENEYQISLKEMENLEKILEENKEIKIHGLINLYVCFCLDLTGSMSSYVQRVSEAIEQSIENLVSEFKSELLIKIALVGYRDFSEGNPEIFNFTDDTNQAKNIAKSWSEKCNGGGNACEDVASGLNAVLNKISWSENALKVCILISDAPNHGRQYNNNCGDSYPDQPEKLLEDIADRYVKNDIVLYCIELNSTTKIMYDKLCARFPLNKSKTMSSCDDMKKTIIDTTSSTLTDYKKNPGNYKINPIKMQQDAISGLKPAQTEKLIESYQNDIKSKTENLKKCKEVLDKQKKFLVDLKNKNDQLEHATIELKTHIEIKDKEIVKLQDDKECLNSENKDLNELIGEQTNVIEENTTIIENLVNDKEQLIQQKESLIQEKKQIEELNKNLQKDLEQTKEEYIESQTINEAQNEIIKEQTQMLNESQMVITQLTEEKSQLEIKNKTLEDQIVTLVVKEYKQKADESMILNPSMLDTNTSISESKIKKEQTKYSSSILKAREAMQKAKQLSQKNLTIQVLEKKVDASNISDLSSEEKNFVQNQEKA